MFNNKRLKDKDKDRHLERLNCRETFRKNKIMTFRVTNRHDRQTDRQTDRQKSRMTKIKIDLWENRQFYR